MGIDDLKWEGMDKNMDDLKKKAQTAQSELLAVVLEFFKQYPEGKFTAGDIVKELGLESSYNNTLPHAVLDVLVKMGELEKLARGDGFKLKEVPLLRGK